MDTYFVMCTGGIRHLYNNNNYTRNTANKGTFAFHKVV